MKVLITGADGFIGKNLQLHLAERQHVEVRCFTRQHHVADLPAMLDDIDFIIHLAGVNRPQDTSEFERGNATLTEVLCRAVAATARCIPLIATSSIQAAADNPYGISKRQAEAALFKLAADTGNPVHVFRLPNVFGKWCKPNYNSVVATFCHNTAQGLPLHIHDPAAAVTLVHVDDVIARFIQLLEGAAPMCDAEGFEQVAPQYRITVGELAAQIQAFRDGRDNLLTERVGSGLVRALYASYISYLPWQSFSYPVPKHADTRGRFVEMLKTRDSGQFSYFTAHPGVTRGGHYHHSKTEKFLVIQGQARFRFRSMLTQETCELVTSGEQPVIVETVPGWTHDITNIGPDELLVMLWANEIFDRDRPDTYACPV